MIQCPVYIGLQPPLFYEWGMETVPQTQLDNRSRPVPCGKGIGGGSIINGMLWNRGEQVDFDSWEELGNPGWSWRDLLPYFRKSETFTPRNYAGQDLYDGEQIDSWNPRVHGFRGPAQVSYPQYLWPQSWAWFEALESLGITKANDPNEGREAGGYFLPLSIDPWNQTRSDARRAYWDPASNRSNFNLALNAQVTHIYTDSGSGYYPFTNGTRYQSGGPAIRRRQIDRITRATAVEFAFSSDSPRQVVFAREEIIMAAGALHTPFLLELSGIGDRSVLSSRGVSTIVDLPGVGNNLQDHAMIHVNYTYQSTSIKSSATLLTNSTYWAESEAQYVASKSGPFTAKPLTAVGFPTLRQITNESYTSQAIALASLDDTAEYLPLGLPSSVLAGYSAQLRYLLRHLNSTSVPAYEILSDNAGNLDLALMHPLSRGTIHIATNDPFIQPSINPNWLAHPLDSVVMLRALEFNQRLLQTPQLAALQPTFNQVPMDASPEMLISILLAGIGTEYHYSGTAAMMPRELGGVVDTNLVVYGTSNLRVVDSSIFPMIPGAHLQAVVYAVAEKAADVIRGDPQGRLGELREGLHSHLPPWGPHWA
jgi:choline dehydrogenase